MKFISYSSAFFAEIYEIHILDNRKSNQDIPGFFKISRDTSRAKIDYTDQPSAADVSHAELEVRIYTFLKENKVLYDFINTE